MTNPRVPGLRVRLRFAVVAVFLLASAAAAESEFERASRLLGLGPGMTVAEIGAGDGEFTIELERRVGPEGRVYATEIETEKRDAIGAQAKEAGLAKVRVLEAQLASTAFRRAAAARCSCATSTTT